jgi:hypothetical protein
MEVATIYSEACRLGRVYDSEELNKYFMINELFSYAKPRSLAP